MSSKTSNTLDALTEVLEQRKTTSSGDSYVASLHEKGLNKILEKVGEEAVEAIIAAKDVASGGSKEELVKETADLWFHSMVMLSHLDLSANDILNELQERFGLSGLEEKASRSDKAIK